MAGLFYGRKTGMDKFLPYTDSLASNINEHATALYTRLQDLDVNSLGLPEHCLYYYNASHSKRLFFSIETSAHLLYKAIMLCGKSVREITLMDYGAGVGTLYLLAKLIGCREVIYNDHLDDWRKSAQLIAESIGVGIDQYIVGDIDACLDRLDVMNSRCDIITSRNVIEHIYKLEDFYSAVSERQHSAVIFSSTTANNSNPASVVKHMLWHRKWEKVFRGKRAAVIARLAPGLTLDKRNELAKATRGLAVKELEQAVAAYLRNGKMPDPSAFRTNTCDPDNGVWAEHLLTENEYRKLIDEKLFKISFGPGFWDTHYSKRYMNLIGRLINRLIRDGREKDMSLAPFIYVIARPR